jgi:hypothetical protein
MPGPSPGTTRGEPPGLRTYAVSSPLPPWQWAFVLQNRFVVSVRRVLRFGASGLAQRLTSDACQRITNSQVDSEAIAALLWPGGHMDRLSKPMEERVRELLSARAAQHGPPLDLVEARRQLEWRLSEEKYQEWRLRLL